MTILWPLAIATLALGVRLWNLGGLPLFTDESLWLRWALNPYYYLPEGSGPLDTLRVSLVGDVNPPMLHVLLLLVLPWVDEPVIGARTVMAVAGALAALGSYLLGTELINRRVGIVAGLVHAVLPLAVFFDRIVHYDALTATCVVYAAWLAARLARTPSVPGAVITGIVLAAGLIVNPRALTIMPAPTLALLLLRGPVPFRRALTCTALSYGVMLVLAPLSFLGVPLSDIYEKVFNFGLTPGEVAQAPTELWARNMELLSTWVEFYVGRELLALAGLGIVAMLVWRPRAGLYTLLIWVCLVAPFIVSAKLIFSRYLAVSAFPPSIAVATLVIGIATLADAGLRRLNVHQRVARIALSSLPAVAILLAGMTHASTALPSMLGDPLHARLPDSDRAQYQAGWYAGVGVPEAAAFLVEESRKAPIIVLRDDAMPGSGVHFYTYRTPSIQHELEPALAFNRNNAAQRIRRWLDQSRPVYFAALEDLSPQQPSRSRRLATGLQTLPEARRVAEFPSTDRQSQVTVFKVEAGRVEAGREGT